MNNFRQVTRFKKDEYQEDFYASDPKTIDDLLSIATFSDDIWEPAAGVGHMTYRLEKLGKKVYSSDSIDRGQNFNIIDFLQSDKKWNGDIITNPPYKFAKEFVEKALSVVNEGNKVAMLLRLLFVESMRRRKLFTDTPPKTIAVYSKRIECKKDGTLDYAFDQGSVACYAWFIWEKGFQGDTILKWI